jgi:hypothetical protein
MGNGCANCCVPLGSDSGTAVVRDGLVCGYLCTRCGLEQLVSEDPVTFEDRYGLSEIVGVLERARLEGWRYR